MKVFIDTNVFLRYFVPENKDLYLSSEKLFEIIEAGKITPYTSNIVIQEIVFVLLRTYKFSRLEIINKLPLLFKLRNLVITEKTNSPKSFYLYQKYNIPFGDCLIAPQIKSGVLLCSYDPDFSKLPGINVVTPSQILAQFAPKQSSLIN